MTTNAATWFYNEPEQSKYYINERVNQTFWQARVGNIWLDCSRAEAPCLMTGTWRDALIEIEWVPNDYFILRSASETDASDLLNDISRIIALKPVLDYTDKEGHNVTEWHVDGGEKRWQEIQGKPAFGNPQRLKR